jgi:hypothetical protein
MLVAAAALVPGAALASGPSGSTEGAPRSKTYNNVKCGKGTNVKGLVVYAGTNGIEACNDGRAPSQLVQGRAIVTSGYVAVDGDRDNKVYGPLDLRNYARADRAGAHCGKQGGVEDSTSASQPAKNKCP